MKYQVGETGRVVVARFEDGDRILEGITQIARDEQIRAGIFHIVGGMKKGKFVVGPQKDELPPVPVWRELDESHEVVGTGTIFWQGDEPKLHFHGAYANFDTVKAGCMRKDAETFLVLEVVIIEIKGVTAVRELDPVSGMVLLKL